MALENKGSYIPTSNEFLAHWLDADAALTPLGLILPEKPGEIPAGFNRSGLLSLRTVLLSQLDAVQDKLNSLQLASSAVKFFKAKMYKRLTLFVGLLDGYYSSTELYAARPELPGEGAAEDKITNALRDMRSLWVRMNLGPAPSGVVLPVQLNEGTDTAPDLVGVAEFELDLGNLPQKYMDRAEAEQGVKLARARRDRTMANIKTVLLAYRAAAATKLAAHTDLLSTLPRVSPQPGHTPDAVSATAVFLAPDVAQITHTESDDADFKEYQLRGTVGDDGDTEDAVVLATHTARTPAVFTTQLGLGAPGGAGSYWVYVITNDGNERASNRMVVERPL
jgi:hypothetical protein